MNPIPEGYHSVTPHLILRDGARVIDFYRQAFGAEELFRLTGKDGKLLHGSIRIGDSVVMLNDEYEGQSSPQALQGSPVVLHIYTEDADALYERATKAGAVGIMPLGNAPWGDRYGVVADPFGHAWAIAQRVEIVADEEVKKRLGL